MKYGYMQKQQKSNKKKTNKLKTWMHISVLTIQIRNFSFHVTELNHWNELVTRIINKKEVFPE